MVNYEQAFKICRQAFNEQARKYEEQYIEMSKEFKGDMSAEKLKDMAVVLGKMESMAKAYCMMTEVSEPTAFREMTEDEKKMVLELQELYESWWHRGKYDKCDVAIEIFCILNKYLTGHTGWRIQFNGSKANLLINPRSEG